MSNWKHRNVLVTGATGLVGTWMCRRLLQEGAQVTALVRDWNPRRDLIQSGDIQRCSVISGRLEDRATLIRAIVSSEIDTVFHFGAQAIVGTALRDPLATLEANVLGTANVLDACRLHGDLVQRVVVASSDKAYGTAEVLPYTEAMPPLGRAPYDVSKSCTDLLAKAYATTYGLPVLIARCGNIYGGGDLNWSRIVPGTIRRTFEGRSTELRSDGTFVRDYLYVQDVVEAYLALAEASTRTDIRGEAFNFSPEVPVTVLEIVRATLDACGRPDLEPIILNTAKDEIRDQYLDASRARNLLGWTPKWTLSEGLKATVAWYRTYLEAGL